ncbi:glycosyltransferase family 2 protein [Hydrogenophaga sp.]|uniref:glycosyltransferase family 2 protein n=1 Tax=Hydrogenophaga sp. TaxID=1904254 RepID=UPI003D0BF5E9
MSNPRNPKLLTALLNFRTADMTLQALEVAVREMEGIDGVINVVDNASGDGSYEKIRDAVKARGWDRVQVIASDHNGGFGAGNNIAIRHGLPDGTAPDFVYLLNSDAFPEPGAVRTLLDHMVGHPTVGLAGSRIHGQDGAHHQTAFRFPTIQSEFEGAARTGPISRLLRNYIVALPPPEHTQPVDWVAGASLMMRRDMLDQIGLFDERFFLYFEETDLCLRARRAGWSTVYVLESRVMHIGSVSTGMKGWKRTPGYWFDSRLWYYTKSHGAFYAALATLSFVAGSAILRARRILGRKRVEGPDHFLSDLVSHALRNLWPRKRMGSAHR